MTTEAGTTTKRKTTSRKTKATGRAKRATTGAAKTAGSRGKSARKSVKPKGSAWRRQMETILEPVRRMFGAAPVSSEVWNESMKVKMADARKLIAKTRKLLNAYADATEEKAKEIAKEMTPDHRPKEGHAST